MKFNFLCPLLSICWSFDRLVGEGLVGWLVCHNFPKRQGSNTSMLLYPYSSGICAHNKHWRQREGKSSGGVRGLGRGPRPQRRSAALPCQGNGHAAQEMNDVMNGKSVNP